MNNYLKRAQDQLGVGPVEMARLLDTNWNTYKAWLYDINRLPGDVRVAIELLIQQKNATTSVVSN